MHGGGTKISLEMKKKVTEFKDSLASLHDMFQESSKRLLLIVKDQLVCTASSKQHVFCLGDTRFG